MPEISIIIPVYNNEKYIEKCVRSVMNQTYSDLEILVINDGSTDGSKKILEKLAVEDQRIRLFSQKNGGVASARNCGLDHAEGTYLTFVDGDDYISSTYIESLYQKASQEKFQMVICGLTMVDEGGKEIKKISPAEYIPFVHEEWAFRISAVCSHFYQRNIWEKHNIRFQPGERGEDMPISLFFSTVCDRIATISDTGYFYVQHQESAIHNFRGLQNYALPYRALEDTIKKIQTVGVANSPEFYELFVLRILATCFFDLGLGASWEKLRQLADYIVYILTAYFPKYYKNKKARMSARLDIPFVQKAAVKVLILLTRTRLIYPTARIMSCREKGADVP
ncbi:MAG: glycosyltransferase [Oscillospiraceae bacterium]|nr:glycosyltransferase [Oscillospiraceae bacterium]